MTNDSFTHYVEPNPVVNDGTRRIDVSLGEVGGLELAYIGVQSSVNRVDALLTLPEVRDLVDALRGIDPEYQPPTCGYYLYRVVITKYPAGAWISEIVDGEEHSRINEDWAPDGWDPGEDWLARFGSSRFFWPSTKREYKSQSAARSRARLIESYGATAVVERSSLIAWPESNLEEQ